MKFNDQVKEVKEFNNNYFDWGVHKVLISAIELGVTDKNQEYMEVTVVDPEESERTESVRVWFTTDKAANYSFNLLRQIALHNTSEEKKDAARDEFDRLKGTEDLHNLIQNFAGGECWLSKYPSLDRTYTNQQGEVKAAVDKNIHGYEPKLNPARIPVKGEAAVPETVRDAFPGAQLEGSSTVPSDDSWSK